MSMGNAITNRAAIPSTTAKAGDTHPLRQRVTQATPGPEHDLRGAPTGTNPRAISSEHFRMPPVPGWPVSGWRQRVAWPAIQL
jgi:hypothetical protein